MVYIKISSQLVLLDAIVVSDGVFSAHMGARLPAGCAIVRMYVSKRREGLKRALVRRLANPYHLFTIYQISKLLSLLRITCYIALSNTFSKVLLGCIRILELVVIISCQGGRSRAGLPFHNWA